MTQTGQLTLNEILIIEVDADPSVGGTAAPIGSIALLDDKTNGRMWIKSAAGDTSWSIIPRFANGTVFSNGSIVFADSSGFFSQNNTQLFWDNSNSRLGLGLASPQSRVHIDAGTAAASAIKFTVGTTTGQTADDGFDVGIDAAGNAEIRQRENSNINFFTNNSRYLQLDSSGRLVVGLNAVAQDITGGSTFPIFQIIGTSAVQMAGIQHSADTIGPVFNLLKSRGAALNTQGLVSQDDEFGRIQFRGSDGTNFQAGASIRGLVDGVAAGGSMPGRLVLMTTPTGSTVPVEHMRITSTGQLGIGTTTPDASAKMQIDSTTQGFLMPRMTSAQRLAISSPPAGLMVYDTNLGCRCIYAGTHWTFEYDIVTTSIQTTTSNTYSDITELTTVSLEPGLYAVRLRGIMQSTATNTGVGLKLLDGSATISELNINWTFSQAAAGTDKNFEYSQLAVGNNVTSTGVVTANANFPVAGDGVVRITAGGTVVVQFRSETNGTGVSIRPNSTLIFRKVGN
jgi:hypothetical protein